jgi:chloramphenicol 3-O-phosphotransferase
MPARVVLLNGPAGVGKTTVGRALAATVPNGACIHGDCFKRFIVSRVEGTVAGGLGYTNGATVAASFVEAGYDLVIFAYVFERRANVDHFLATFGPPVPVHLFTLWAPLHVIMERERTRPDRKRLGRRVAACYRAIEQDLDQLGYRIENVDVPPHDVAREIYHLCTQDLGVVNRQR